jgi:uncharacterized membrane protein
MNSKNILYALACLSFSIVIGGAVYEHLAVVPQWSAAPPLSLSMFQGEYKLDAGAFWKLIHPVTLLFIISNLVIFWKTERRKNLLFTLAGYGTILLLTAMYFVPELMDITGTSFSQAIDASLTKRAALWELLSILRLCVLIILAMSLFLGLTKGSIQSDKIAHYSRAEHATVNSL